jgi:phosphatidylinositol glycan class B
MNKKIILIGIIVHLIAAVFSVGYYHVDEHFQILEFTSLKLELAQPNDLPWEYQARLRPALQPAIAYIIIKIMQTVSLDNPFFQAMNLRIISALLSLWCMYLLIWTFDEKIRDASLKQWFIFFSVLIWFMPYLHARFSSENWSGFVFWIGFALLLIKNPGYQLFNKKYFRDLLIGIILGLSFVLRFQMGLMIAGLLLWLFIIKKEKHSRLLLLILGMLIPLMLGLLIDYWFYGDWTFTAWNYLKVNIIENRTADFGVEPWWYYPVEIIVKGIPPFSIVIIMSTLFIWFYYPRHILTWATIPYLAVHLLIGHKELRFLFPLINILPFVLVLSFQVISENERFYRIKTWVMNYKKHIIYTFLAINTILLMVVCVKPADMHIYLYQYVYNQYDPEETELLYINKSPFHARAVPVNFYRKKNMALVKFKTSEELVNYARQKEKTFLFTTEKANLDSAMKILGCANVFQTLPQAANYININHWVERTPKWILYECRAVQ